MKLPKATHEGKIGNVDCYVLDNGKLGLSFTKTLGILQGNSHAGSGNGESKRVPRWMSAIFAKLYRKFIGAEAYALLKSKNPHPSRETVLHHQWLVDAILDEIKAHIKAIVYIANRSGKSKQYFWEQIDELLGIAKQHMLPSA